MQLKKSASDNVTGCSREHESARDARPTVRRLQSDVRRAPSGRLRSHTGDDDPRCSVPDLEPAAAYLLKETLAAALDRRQPNVANRPLLGWTSWVSRSGLAPFAKVARTITAHLDGIIGYVALGCRTPPWKGPTARSERSPAGLPQRNEPYRDDLPMLLGNHTESSPSPSEHASNHLMETLIDRESRIA